MEQLQVLSLLLGIMARPSEALLTDGEPCHSAADWREILACAIDQYMGPLLYYEVKRAGLDWVPPTEVWQALQGLYRQNAARNLRLNHELSGILDRLADAAIPAIVLKGAFLASAVYSNPALRSMGDLDILVASVHLPMAIAALERAGYRTFAPPWVNVGSDIQLRAPGHMAPVEIHWGLAPQERRYRVPIEHVWRTAVPLEIAGSRAWALAPEELLLYLCYHGAAKHLFMQGCRSLMDVDWVVRRYGSILDWSKVDKLGESWGLAKALQLTLFLCHEYLQTPAPVAICRAVPSNNSEGLMREALVRLSMHESAIDVASSNYHHIQQGRNLTNQLFLFLTYLFRLPEIPNVEQPYRKPLLTFYYTLRRLIYLLEHYSGALWQLVRDGLGRRSTGVQSRLRPWLES